MKIELSHVIDLGKCIDIHLYVSTKNSNNYFEKLFGLTEENGRYLIVHVLKEKEEGTYPYPACIEGTIYDKNGEVCTVPNRIFHEDDCDVINTWINEHKEEWIKAIEE